MARTEHARVAATDAIVATSHADIAVRETGGRGGAVILLHGNSSSKDVFVRQLDGPLGAAYRMIAIDLPGHGGSSDALDPRRTYSMPGYAEAVLEIVTALEIDRAAVFGWSLGGHVALELMPRWSGMTGLMITGAPPVSPTAASLQAGFLPTPEIALAGQETLSDAEAKTFLRICCGKKAPASMLAAVKRTDGRARKLMVEHLMAGKFGDQRAIAEGATVPLAIVTGEHEPFANPAYLQGLRIPNLWEAEVHTLAGVGHAPFYEDPDTFNPIFLRFLRDVARRPRVAAR
jgi:pimeloyl-ACP methyl ester carboxylesterase